MAKVYLAGDMLNRGAQMQRADERDFLKANGHELYNPMDNKDINDKANAVQEGLAERIVKQDTDAIKWSDTVVIEPLTHAVGTCIELGQIKGMRDLALEIDALLPKTGWNYIPAQLVESLQEVVNRHLNRKVYPHYEDVRRLNEAPQQGDRREFGMHQYIYGVCLDLTEGKGVYSWDEIKDALKNAEAETSKN